MGLLDFDLGNFGFDFSDPGGLTEFGGFDLGGFDLGGLDFGDFDLSFPSFYDMPEVGGEGYATDLSGLMFDTTTGQITLPGGERLSESDLGDTTLRTRGLLEGAPGQLPRPGSADVFGGVLGGINKALEGSALARAIAAGTVGAAGLGAARLFGGPEPTLQLPSYKEAKETRALRAAALPGQLTLAGQLAERAAREAAAEREQAPGERDVRLQSLARMGGFLPGGAEDPIVAGLRAEAIRALSPTYTDPLVEESIRLAQEEQMNRLYRQYGDLASAQTSTPGIDTMARFAAQRGLARAGARQSAIGAYAPAAISAEQGIQGLRRQNLGDVERLSRFGIEGVPQTATTLGQLAGSPEQANLVNLGLQQQAALAAYNQAGRSREQLAAGIGGIAGNVAGAIGQRPSRLEDLLRTYGYV